MKRSYSSTLSLTDLTESFWHRRCPLPTEAYCSKVSSEVWPLGIIINISCEMSLQ